MWFLRGIKLVCEFFLSRKCPASFHSYHWFLVLYSNIVKQTYCFIELIIQVKGWQKLGNPYRVCIHCKKVLAVFPSQVGMSLTKLSLAGNHLIIPGQGEFGKWHPRWGRENSWKTATLFYSVVPVLMQDWNLDKGLRSTDRWLHSKQVNCNYYDKILQRKLF